jgi:predicted DNA-binding transcriptional regulator AlpA
MKIRIRELVKKVGLTRKDINDQIRRGRFPPANVLGDHPFWHENEVDQWMLGKWPR